ncbi:Probable conserved transmembrane protein [Actinomycetales bacterium JB111]|nr:Probable conserved transmembrane protein [Actinomycetales bacterium JB111]
MLDPGLMVSEVGLRLRAGSAPARAWTTALRRARVIPDGEEASLDPTGIPRDLLDVAERLAGGRGRRSARGVGSGERPSSARVSLGSRAERAAATGAMAGVLVACRVTHATGAPLADVLDRSAAGIAEAGRAAGARAVALAGPRATGRLLGWLPVLGLLLGAVVGADPVGTLLDGGIGTVCLLVGLVMLAVGWVWVLRAERRAEGSSP